VVLRALAAGLSIVGAALSLGAGPPPAATAPGVQAETGARAGSLYGRVQVNAPPPHHEQRPRVAALGGGIDREPPEPPPSVVYLNPAPGVGRWRLEPSRALMDQRNETFVPHVLALTVGSTVEFPNSDGVYHNVFSLSKPARFDLGRYAAGRSKTVRFDRPGVVRVFCDIHSHMNAFILVFAHPFFAVTDATGRFRIPEVPPGTHEVVAWREGTASAPRAVTVPEGGTTELNFVLP
jgi:hypothetical protein